MIDNNSCSSFSGDLLKAENESKKLHDYCEEAGKHVFNLYYIIIYGGMNESYSN